MVYSKTKRGAIKNNSLSGDPSDIFFKLKKQNQKKKRREFENLTQHFIKKETLRDTKKEI